jgi:hypothetical protein
VAQFDPEPNYDHRLQERVIQYLQTRDWRLFPFSEGFDDAKRRAFVRDLREGLAGLTDSGSARKTSATGFLMRDQLLKEIVIGWAAAKGGWPEWADPADPEGVVGVASH